MVDPGRLKEAAAFERIRLLCFFYFCDSEISGPVIRMDDFKGASRQKNHWGAQ